MLKQLRFKNWRSLRDVTIDLSPLTVFIGANSSGKTNIIDALLFRREISTKDILDVLMDFGRERILSYHPLGDKVVELGFFFEQQNLGDFGELLKFDIQTFNSGKPQMQYAHNYYRNGKIIEEQPFITFPSHLSQAEIEPNLSQKSQNAMNDEFIAKIMVILRQQYRHRWQILKETLAVRVKVPQHETGNRYLIEPDANNTLLVLEMLEHYYNGEFEALAEDASWLMEHINDMYVHLPSSINPYKTLILGSLGSDGESYPNPTISTGTQRLLAMLAAMHVLNVPQDTRRIDELQYGGIISPSTPGLVVIEEPDTALNPGVLRKFVELLRGYVENPDGTRPRQIIMTTHNPTFLNYFQPDEVRVVERGEDGYTTVNRVPDYVKDIWLKDGEYALGEVWLGNSFGGLP